jgi:hypothetical protein
MPGRAVMVVCHARDLCAPQPLPPRVMAGLPSLGGLIVARNSRALLRLRTHLMGSPVRRWLGLRALLLQRGLGLEVD